MNRLKEKYISEIVPSLREKHNYKSVTEVPKLDKIVVNIGVGEASHDSKFLEAAQRDLEAISGQKEFSTTASPLKIKNTYIGFNYSRIVN